MNFSTIKNFFGNSKMDIKQPLIVDKQFEMKQMPTMGINKDTIVDQNKQQDTEFVVTEGESTVQPTETPKQYPNLVVVLDPGHASSTAGKRSPYSLGKVSEPALPLEEWAYVRDITYRVKEILNKYGIEVFVTTTFKEDGETDLGLSKRAQRANAYVKDSSKKGLLISIHADADGMGDKWTKAHGWSCFTTKGQNNSDKLADCLYDAAEEILPKYEMTIRTDKKDGDRDWEEDFTVLYKANMPAVLTENLFYTNIKDCEFLISDKGRDAIVDIHVKGILKFAETFYKM